MIRCPTSRTAPQPSLLTSVTIVKALGEVGGMAHRMKWRLKRDKKWRQPSCEGRVSTRCNALKKRSPLQMKWAEWFSQPRSCRQPYNVEGIGAYSNFFNIASLGAKLEEVDVTPKYSKRSWHNWHLSQFTRHPSLSNSANKISMSGLC